MTRAWFIGVIVVTLLAGRSAEAATKKERVRTHKMRAFKLFESGNYAGGIAEMEKAYALIPHPGFLLNIAVAYDQWPGHCAESLETFERFFTECDGCKLLQGAKKTHAEVEGSCRVEVSIRSSPDGARVAVDGAFRGKTPYTTRLLPGEYAIVLDLFGHERATSTLEVERGQPREMSVSLVPRLAPPPPPPLAVETETERAAVSPFTWVAFGAGAAGIATGAAFTVLTMRALDREEEARSTPLPKAEIEAIQQEARRDAVLAYVGYGVGVAGIATGVLLLLVTGGEEKELAHGPEIGPPAFGLLRRRDDPHPVGLGSIGWAGRF